MLNLRVVVIGGLLSLASSAVSAGIVYKAPENVFGGLCPTCAGTATTMGDYVSLASGPSKLTQLTWDTSNFGADYDAEIRVELFNVDDSGLVPDLGSLIHTQTSTHFLEGGNGDSKRSFVDIFLPNVVVPESLIYTIAVTNNNGSTNWNVSGFLSDSAVTDTSAGEAVVGVNDELFYVFGDWVPEADADESSLTVGRLGMASYQLGLSQFADFANHSSFTPNVTISGQAVSVSEPGSLALLALGLAGLSYTRRKSSAQRQS